MLGDPGVYGDYLTLVQGSLQSSLYEPTSPGKMRVQNLYLHSPEVSKNKRLWLQILSQMNVKRLFAVPSGKGSLEK
ncbi:MAG: hypothetical protein KGY41_05435 [Desulfovermiculus sp.]|nr:hypothetical protein [Desulfovermiculus sp.]